MHRTLNAIISFILFASSTLFTQTPAFNSDSSYAYLKHLAVEIGPRVMGSPNELEALQWTADKFRAFGADTAYVLEMDGIPGGVNTTSGTAVGVFKGEIDSAIVIGGHIDSDRLDNPGASDNASGTACTIELARIWSERPHRYTLIFCAFGAEERGLQGSKHFVANDDHIDDVVLMFSIDMAGTKGWLIPFIDIKTHQSPEWLVADAFAMDRALGYNDMEYPVHFFSLNSAIGGASSDHMPFMEKDIPAIDFTAGINIDPIHTPNDVIDFVNPAMLERSGRLVDELVIKYDRDGVPAETKGNYMLLPILGGNIFFPKSGILIVNLLAFLLAFFAFYKSINLSRERASVSESKIPGLKLFAIMLLVAVFMQLGEAILQALTGWRFPWLVHVQSYFWFAGWMAVLGLWVGAQLADKWTLRDDPYVYARRALVALALLSIVPLLLSARLGLYMTVPMLLLACSIIFPSAIARTILVLCAMYPIPRLMFHEAMPFISRTLAGAGFDIDTMVDSLIYSGILALVCTFLLVALLYMLVYIVLASSVLHQLFRFFRTKPGGVVVLVIAAFWGGYLYSLPASDAKWKPEVRLGAEQQLPDGEAKVVLAGNDYLRDVSVAAAGESWQFDGATSREELPIEFSADWLTISGEETRSAGDSLDTLRLDWQLISAEPWYSVRMSLLLDTLGIDSVWANMNYVHGKGGPFTASWAAYPTDTIPAHISMLVPKNARLIRDLICVYSVLPFEARVESPHHHIGYRTTITYRDTL